MQTGTLVGADCALSPTFHAQAFMDSQSDLGSNRSEVRLHSSHSGGISACFPEKITPVLLKGIMVKGPSSESRRNLPNPSKREAVSSTYLPDLGNRKPVPRRPAGMRQALSPPALPPFCTGGSEMDFSLEKKQKERWRNREKHLHALMLGQAGRQNMCHQVELITGTGHSNY